MSEAYSYQTNAPKGAELLDRVMPGWAERIDMRTFDIDSPFSCILAQLAELGDDDHWSPYNVGRRQVFDLAGITPDDDEREAGHYRLAMEYGFDYSAERGINVPVSLLQDEWELLINERS